MDLKHPNRILIGITGVIGSGKSTALALFGELGTNTFSSDQIARKFTEPNSQMTEELVSLFGKGILDGEGNIHRPSLAAIAFATDENRSKLNKLLHPAVRSEFLKQFYQTPPNSITAWEVPLLFETDAHTICDFTVTVSVPETEIWPRIQARGGMEKQDWETRKLAQFDQEKKKSLSDFTLENDTDREGLKSQIVLILKEIQKRTKL